MPWNFLRHAQPPEAPPRLPAAVALGFVVLFLLLDWISFVHPMRGTHITAWNPQAALAIALLTHYPSSGWLVGPLMAAAAAWRGLPDPAVPTAVAALVSTLGFMATAAALRRALGPETRNAYLAFLAIAAVGAALQAGLYVGTLSVVGFEVSDRVPGAFIRRWVADAVSIIVSLPVIFVLADRGRRAQTLAMLRTVEWWLVAAAALAASYAVFGRPAEDQFKFFYLLFVPVAWGAARFGNVGAVWSAALVQALLFTAVQADTYRPLTVFELHMLMTALGATGLLLGATVEERQRAEEALRASLHAAAAADMAAAMAHELNQPLTALRTYARAAQLMAQQPAAAPGAGGPPLVEVTDKLVAEVNRAGAVMKRLRDFFRERGTELQPVALQTVIDEVVQSQAAHADAAGVTLQADCPPELPPVWIDAVQIAVVLRNLVSNAIEAAAPAPAARFPLQPAGRFPAQPAARVIVQAEAQGRQLVVRVQDSGPGIAADELGELFESRAGSRASAKPGGMGIGLVISRSIIEAHEGRLWAEAGPGGKFSFSIPLLEPDHA
jgi:two-component system, LuxR family, sensor kinase FixL